MGALALFAHEAGYEVYGSDLNPGPVVKELEAAGCEILRVAIPDHEAVALIPKIKEAISIPLVADIHFDYRLAAMA